MRTRPARILLQLALCFIVQALASRARAAQSMVTLSATQDVILADGKSQTIITADVRDSSGRPADGIEVLFQTTSGTLSQSRVMTFNGRGQTRLTSSTVAGIATVNAFAGAPAGGAANPLTIEFTNDPDAAYAGNSFALITGNYVEYCVTQHVIEADGRNGAARLTYRNFDVKADRLQLSCDQSGLLRAMDHITLKRGKDVIHAIRLYYSMVTGEGYAIANWNGKLQPVMISGEHLSLQACPGRIPASYLELPTLQVKLVVVARSIAYFPGDKLQFRRARFFQDQAQLLVLPYYEMSLSSTELFSDHFISVGTHGLGLQIPYYYNLSPRTAGILTIRHEQQLGWGYYSTDPGWSIDLLQSYTSTGPEHYEGNYGFTGLTHSDWGFHWTHSDEFSPVSQGSFVLDFPHHNSIFSSLDLATQQKQFHVGLDLTGGSTFITPKDSSYLADAYLESVPRPFPGLKGMQWVVGTKLSTGHYWSQSIIDPSLQAQTGISDELTFRSFTRPYALDARTSLTGSFTVGHVWSTGPYSGTEGLATLALDHTLSGGGAINLTYDFLSTPTSVFDAGGRHRLSLTYQFRSHKRFQAALFGSAFLDAPVASVLGDAVYRLNSDWRLLFSATLQSDAGQAFKDFEFTLGRRIGARELQLTYSTYLKRISIDLTSTQW